MNIEVNTEENISNVLAKMGTCIQDEGMQYYFLPYWFEVIDCKLIAHELGNLPKPLVHIIESHREEII